jgi:dihydrofolate synthase / folylpolyglutamate synthase
MILTPIKTKPIEAGQFSLTELLDQHVTSFEEKNILAITSKIVSLCENRVVPIEGTSKDDLIQAESDYHLPASLSQYGYHFTITNHTLISMAGIDESNGNGNYILWPKNSQATANEVRQYLVNRFHITYAGVVIVDSTSTPFRLGTSGIALGFSGFMALNNYIGTPDLFGRPFNMSQSNVAGGLAAASALVMGEGTESTPLVVMADLPFVQFLDRNPDQEELKTLHISKEDDLFEPFLKTQTWLKGNRQPEA